MTDAPAALSRLVALAVEAGISAKIDEPMVREGAWWVDLEHDGVRAEVEWRHDRGFGLYDKDAGFGSRPDRFVEDPAEALRQAMEDARAPAR